MHLNKAYALQQLDAQLAASKLQIAGLKATNSQLQADLAHRQSQASEESRLANEQHSTAVRELRIELAEVQGARDSAESAKQVGCDSVACLLASALCSTI